MMWNFWRFILKSELRTLWKKVIKWEAEEKLEWHKDYSLSSSSSGLTNKQSKDSKNLAMFYLFEFEGVTLQTVGTSA